MCDDKESLSILANNLIEIDTYRMCFLCLKIISYFVFYDDCNLSNLSIWRKTEKEKDM